MSTPQVQREIARFVSRTPGSRALQQEAARYLPGGSSRTTAYFEPYPIFVDRGEGHYVYDVDGNRYLDFMLNATSLILGHAHPAIVGALQEQASRGTAFSAPTEAQIRLARLLCERLPSLDTVRFTNSGTEATLMALRAARAFTRKPKIAKFEGGYHGSHEYVSVSVRPPAARLDPAGPTALPEYPGQPPGVIAEVLVLPYNDLPRCARLLRQHREELACVLVEPVASAFGYLPARREFLVGLRELTAELGLLLIFDEVQSVRLAPGGAQEVLGVVPDLTCLGKTIGGGMPVGAFGGRAEVMALFDPTRGAPLAHAGTFNANPMTMVAGEATLRCLTPEVYARLGALGESLRQQLRALFARLQVPAQVTGIGSFFGIHFTAEAIVDYRSVLRGDRTLAQGLFVGLINEGILLQSSCAGALCTLTTAAEVEALVAAVERVMRRLRSP
ncbi:MAG: aspartate aminotransferase family protein [Candidatus Tectimicrobiota bacterium]|nr:MAG: aspartate aminotransferase family protein [Candidatus Tectomicrobia bacterium]